MAVSQVWASFDSYIYLLGGREAIPPNALRVGTGVHPVHGHSVRSRNANVQLSTNSAYSAITFYGDYYTVTSNGSFQRNFTQIATIDGGARLSFAKAPPAVGNAAYLFAVGGGKALKVSSSGVVSNWGIAAPPNGSVTATLKSVGAFNSGFLGNYQYLWSFSNSATGTISEPNKTALLVTGADQSHYIQLSGLPTTSSDPQVDTLVLWRTQGNGGLFFKDATIPLAGFGGTYNDFNGDFEGFGVAPSQLPDWTSGGAYNTGDLIHPSLHNAGGYVFVATNIGVASTTEPIFPQAEGETVVDGAVTWMNVGNTLVLGTAQLIQGLSTLPPSTCTACIFFQGTMFLCGDTAVGARGRIYYSAAAFGAEGIAGFTDISNDDDPTVGFATYAGNLYVLTTKGVWIINNLTTTPTIPGFSATILGQAPGCGSLQSIQTTPLGIIYQTNESDLHLFNGFSSANLLPQILALLEDQAVEGYAPISKVVAATYGRDEYWFSDGSGQLWVANIMPQSLPGDVQILPRPVRCHGTAATALYYEPETGKILAGWNNGTYHLEEFNAIKADDGTGTLPFAVRPSSFYSGDKYVAKGMRVFVDCNDGANMLSVYASVDGTDYLLGTTSGNGARTKYEFPFNVTGSVIGVYITSTSGINQIEIFRVALETDGAGASDVGTGGGQYGQLAKALNIGKNS